MPATSYPNKPNKERRKISCKKYEKTINGFLMRTYRNMKSRILGIQKLKAHLYKNKELLNKKDFYSWSKNNENFINLFKIWEKSNYNRKLTPSIDRIDPLGGYYLENMRWITHSENSTLGSKSPLKKIPVKCLETNVNYDSLEEAGKLLNTKGSYVSWTIKNNRKCKGFTFIFIKEQVNSTEN